jgi:hypothetical protein
LLSAEGRRSPRSSASSRAHKSLWSIRAQEGRRRDHGTNAVCHNSLALPKRGLGSMAGPLARVRGQLAPFLAAEPEGRLNDAVSQSHRGGRASRVSASRGCAATCGRVPMATRDETTSSCQLAWASAPEGERCEVNHCCRPPRLKGGGTPPPGIVRPLSHLAEIVSNGHQTLEFAPPSECWSRSSSC